MTAQSEALNLARFHAGLATKHLQETLTASDAVTALVILQMIAESAKVSIAIDALIFALTQQKKEPVYQD